MTKLNRLVIVFAALFTFQSLEASVPEPRKRFVQIAAKDKFERTKIANMGVSIEAVRSDSVWGFATREALDELRNAGFRILGDFHFRVGRGGHGNSLDFPQKDERFHNYTEIHAALKELQDKNPDIAMLGSIGRTIENREIWALHINTHQRGLRSGRSSKPGIVYMGNHHAREHLSAEIPLMFAQYLLENRNDPQISRLLDTRDIWIIPMVNPDGVEYDINGSSYKWWRKNRRRNSNGTYGVDLNRNYGFMWGTGGSSKDPSSDVYMGTEPFSEPESTAIRDFIRSLPNVKVLLSFHTFSELILYPWGHTYDPIGKKLGNARDLRVFETLAKTMSQWNGYTPQQSSDLYIASGDTTDWAYGELGIFAFTFELSPKTIYQGGFYPGAKIIDKVFADNLKPSLYLLDIADNPYKVIDGGNRWLKNYIEPGLPEELMWQTHPYKKTIELEVQDNR